MFLRMFRQGSRFASWNIIPISSGRGPVTGVPSTTTSPLVNACRPAAAQRSVVLPQPLEPDDADELSVLDVEGEVL